VLQAWAKDHNFDLATATYCIQGYGNVGSWTARLLKPLGTRLLAVEDHTGAIVNTAGIDADDLAAYVGECGGLAGYPQGEPVTHRTFMGTHVDIFVPAALENQITAETAPWLNVGLVVEGANGPTDQEGDRILQDRGICVLPDVLCNAGGVIVSYFEWLQNKRSEFWDLEEVDTKLYKKIVGSYRRVLDTTRTYNTDWRTAAYIVALKRLETVYNKRGIFP
jgi:glutamate dehydrogenase (NAD(P)+)